MVSLLLLCGPLNNPPGYKAQDQTGGPFALTSNRPLSHVFPIAPSDANEILFVTNAINVSNGCLLQVTMVDQSTEQLYFPAGTTYIRVRKVWQTNSTLSGAQVRGLV